VPAAIEFTKIFVDSIEISNEGRLNMGCQIIAKLIPSGVPERHEYA
jgi:hypothetical protein